MVEIIKRGTRKEITCPKCGEPISTHYVNGTGECDACGFRFGVVEDNESEGSDNA